MNFRELKTKGIVELTDEHMDNFLEYLKNSLRINPDFRVKEGVLKRKGENVDIEGISSFTEYTYFKMDDNEDRLHIEQYLHTFEGEFIKAFNIDASLKKTKNIQNLVFSYNDPNVSSIGKDFYRNIAILVISQMLYLSYLKKKELGMGEDKEISKSQSAFSQKAFLKEILRNNLLKDRE